MHKNIAFAVFVLALILGMGRGAQAAQKCHDQASVFALLASDLVAGLRGRVRVAVQPFDATQTDVGAKITERLNEALIRTLHDKGGQRVSVVSRQDLKAVWREVENFQGDELYQHLNEVGGDVLVIGRLNPLPQGVAIRYKAFSLKTGERGQVIAFTDEHCLALDMALANTLPLDAALRRAATELANRSSVRAGIGKRGVRFRISGDRTRFGDHVTSLFIERLQTAIEGVNAKGWTVITGKAGEDKAKNQREDLWIASTVADLGKAASVVFTLYDRKNEIARQSLRIATSSIPRAFLPLKISGGTLASGVFEATGEAIVGKVFNAPASLRAAQALARARVVGQALGRRVPGSQVARDVDDGAQALAFLARGIPYAEEWSVRKVVNGRAIARLRAKVALPGGRGSPDIMANLSPRIVKAGQPLLLEIKSDRRAHVGVYAWQADATVVRLYPKSGKTLLIAPGQRLNLPKPDEPIFASAPMPGSRADHEGIVIIAGAFPFDASALAPLLGGSVQESLSRAVSASAFLTRLAKVGIETSTIRFLPYQVVR